MRSDELIHIGAAKDGSVVMFPFSAYYWIKVCNPTTGVGGVVNLGGAYYPVSELEKQGLGLYCKQIFDNLDECYYGESVE